MPNTDGYKVNQDKLGKFYDNLEKTQKFTYEELGDRDVFVSKLSDPQKLNSFYDKLYSRVGDGPKDLTIDELGSRDAFLNNFVYYEHSAPDTPADTTGPRGEEDYRTWAMMRGRSGIEAEPNTDYGVGMPPVPENLRQDVRMPDVDMNQGITVSGADSEPVKEYYEYLKSVEEGKVKPQRNTDQVEGFGKGFTQIGVPMSIQNTRYAAAETVNQLSGVPFREYVRYIDSKYPTGEERSSYAKGLNAQLLELKEARESLERTQQPKTPWYVAGEGATTVVPNAMQDTYVDQEKADILANEIASIENELGQLSKLSGLSPKELENIRAGLKASGKEVGSAVQWAKDTQTDAYNKMSALPQAKGFGAELGSMVPQVLPTTIAMGMTLIPGMQGVGAAMSYATMGTLSAMAAGGAAYEIDRFENEHGVVLTPAQRLVSVVGAAAIEMGTEKLGFDMMMPKGVAGKIIQRGMLKSVSPKAAERLLKKFVAEKPGLSSFVIEGLEKFAKGSIPEGFEEGLSELGNYFLEGIYKDPEEMRTWQELLKDTGKSMMFGSILSVPAGTMNMVGSPEAGMRKQSARKQNNGFATIVQQKDGKYALEVVGTDTNGDIIGYTHNGVEMTMPKDEAGSWMRVSEAKMEELDRFAKDPKNLAKIEKETMMIDYEMKLNDHIKMVRKDGGETPMVQEVVLHDGRVVFVKSGDPHPVGSGRYSVTGPGSVQSDGYIIGVDPTTGEIVQFVRADVKEIHEATLESYQKELIAQYESEVNNMFLDEEGVADKMTGLIPKVNDVRIDASGQEYQVQDFDPDAGKSGEVYTTFIDEKGRQQTKPWSLEQWSNETKPAPSKEEKEAAMGQQEEEGQPEKVTLSYPSTKAGTEEQIEARKVSDTQYEVGEGNMKANDAKKIANKLNDEYPNIEFKVVDNTDKKDPLAKANFSVVGNVIQTEEQGEIAFTENENIEAPDVKPSGQADVPGDETHNAKVGAIQGLSGKAQNAAEDVFSRNNEELMANLQTNGASERTIAAVQAEIDAGNAVEAFYDPDTGKVYWVTENLSDDPVQLQEKWVHEQGVHHGIRQLTGDPKALNALMDKIFNDIGENRINEVVPMEYRDANGNIKAEEYLAFLGEKMYSGQELSSVERNIWQAIIDEIRMMLGMDAKFTDADIERIIRASVDKVMGEKVDTSTKETSSQPQQNDVTIKDKINEKYTPLVDKRITINGEEGVMRRSEGGVFTVETKDKIYEISDLKDNIIPIRENKVQDVSESTAIINGKQYDINTDNNGNIVSLSNDKDIINDENTLINVEIQRNKLDNRSEDDINGELENQGVPFDERKAIDNLLSQNMSEKIVDILDNGVTESTDEGAFLEAELWIEDAIKKIDSLYPDSEYAQSIKESLRDVQKIIDNEADTRETKGDNEQNVKPKEDGTKEATKEPEPKAEPKPEEVKPEPKKQPKPIRQLGTGNDVYYESKKLRVNTRKKGKTLLNINDNTDNPLPSANIEFDDAAEAVSIAERLDKMYPDGVPEAVDVEKLVGAMRKDPNYENRKVGDNANNDEGIEIVDDTPKQQQNPEPKFAGDLLKPDKHGDKKGEKQETKPKSPKEERANGYKTIEGERYDRQKPITNKAEGKEVSLDFTEDKSLTGKYTVMEADEVQSSHVNKSRNPYHFIPEAQPKERIDNASEMASDKIAKKLSPEKITNNTTNAYNGLPTVNNRGEVIQGNNRVSALKKYHNTNSKDSNGYRQYLIDNADRMGFSEAEVDKIKSMKNPVLVNMVEISDEQAIEYGQYSANDLESGGRRAISAKETVKKAGNKLPSIVEILTTTENDDTTLKETIRDNAIKALKFMWNAGIINDTQYESAFKNTPDGKRLVKKEAIADLESILTYNVLEGARADIDVLFEALPAKVQNAIIKSSHRMSGESSLIPDIQVAISAYYEYLKSGMKEDGVDSWSRTTDMFNGGITPKDSYGDSIIKLVETYDTKKEKEIISLFKEYQRLVEGEDGLFPVAPISKGEAFKNVFKTEYNERPKTDSPKPPVDGRGNEDVTPKSHIKDSRGGDGKKEEGKKAGEHKGDAEGDRPKPKKSGGKRGTTKGRPPLTWATKEGVPTPKEFTKEGEYAIAEDQRTAVNLINTAFVQNNKKGFLLSDGTGVGKTREILAAADKYHKETGKPVLIITESKQIIADSFEKDAKAMGIDLSMFEVGTYDALRTGKIGGKEYGMVVYDEAHNLKNADSLKTIAAGKVKTEHNLYVTATPMDTPSGSVYFISKVTSRSEADVYAEMGFKVTKVKDLNGNYTGAINITIAKGNTPETIRKNIVAIREEMISDGLMLRREFPFYGESTTSKIKLNQEQREEQDLIDNYWQEVEEAAENDQGFIPPKKLMSIRGQASGEFSRWNESTKIEYVFDAVMKDIAAGKKVVVIAEGINPTYIKGLDQEVPGFIGAIEQKLRDAGVKFASIHGENDKAEQASRFQNGDVDVVIGTPKSAGTGIDLDDQIGGNPRKMYMVTPNYSGNMIQQITGRVSRRNTKSAAELVMVFNDSWSDGRRQQIAEGKLKTLNAIQNGVIEDEFDMENIKPEPEEESVGGFEFIDISTKAFVVKGDTKPIKEKLKSAGARWNKNQQGWMFPLTKKAEIQELLKGLDPKFSKHKFAGDLFAKTNKTEKINYIQQQIEKLSDSFEKEVADRVEAEKNQQEMDFESPNNEDDGLPSSKRKGNKFAGDLLTKVNKSNTFVENKVNAKETPYGEKGYTGEPPMFSKGVSHQRNKAIDASPGQLSLWEQVGYKQTSNDNRLETYYERLLEEKKGITFMGSPLSAPAKITSANDVAFLFKNLESAATENAFAVHHKPNGDYKVQYLGTGATGAVIVDTKLVVAAAKDFGAESVTFVHNHPSGVLEASGGDYDATQKIRSLLGLVGIKTNKAIIIDTDQGLYSVINDKARTSETKQKEEVTEPAVEVPVYSFDKSKLYVPSNEKTKIDSPEAVGAFLSKMKRGTTPKIHLISCGNSLYINHYELLDETTPQKEIISKALYNAGKYGERIFLASNKNVSEEFIRELKRALADANGNLLDVITIKQSDGVRDKYSSYENGDNVMFSKKNPQTQTKEFKKWFGDSKVVDENGKPKVVLHGTGTTINAFDPKFSGIGNQQLGSGFYFTDKEETANGYTSNRIKNDAGNYMEKPGGEDSPNIVDAYLSIKKPIIVKGSNLNDAEYNLTKSQTLKILKRVPKIMDPEESPLGDYFAEYWDGGPKLWMLEKLADTYSGKKLIDLDNDFFDGEETAFRKAVHLATGYDGVIKKFGDDETHYVAWFPNQIKSASKNNGEFSEDNPDIRFSKTKEHKFAGDFFKPNKIKNTPFYSNVEEALKKVQPKGTVTQMKKNLLNNGAKPTELDWMGFDNHFPDGEKKVTKADIQEWIDQNKVEVEEVVKGKVGERPLKAVSSGAWTFNVVDEETGEVYLRDVSMQVADDYMDGVHNGTDTKFSEHTLPGGENYKETLLKLPEKKENNFYYKSHFPDANILTHIRQKDRTATNGDKVLFVEEFQSDWAQEGRDKGFKADVSKMSDEEVIDAYAKKNDAIVSTSDDKKEISWTYPNGDITTEPYDKGIQYLRGEFQDEKISDMPFKKTDQWLQLAMKHTLHEAAQHGYDRVAWTTGAQQAERYNLSKQISQITYTSDDRLDAYDNYGQNIMTEYAPINKIDNYIGKEAADKIRQKREAGEKSIILKNQDLQVGGEGMESFYDNIVPKNANKIGKPFNAKVEPTTIEIEGKEIQFQSLPVTEKMKDSTADGVPLFSKKKSLTKKGEQQSSEKLIKTKRDEFRYKWVDNWSAWDKLQKLKGVKVTDSTDVHSHATKLSSRNEYELNQFNEKHQIPLLKILQKISSEKGVSFDFISNYLMHKHAPERMQTIEERTNGQNTHGAGIKNDDGEYKTIEEIEEDIKNYESVIGEENVEALWREINGVTKFRMDKLLESGRISQDGYDKIMGNGWEHYVPLQSWKFDKLQDIYDLDDASMGSDMLKLNKARGRSSEADDPITTMLRAAHSAIINGNFNKLKSRAYRLILNNPDLKNIDIIGRYEVKVDENEDKWEPYKGTPTDKELEAGLDNKKGGVRIREDYTGEFNSEYHAPSNAATNDFRVPVWINGQQMEMDFSRDNRLAEALNRKNIGEISAVGRKIARPVTKFMSAVNTSFNPGFFLNNMVRDIGFAVSTALVEDPKMGIHINPVTYAEVFAAMSKRALGKPPTTKADHAILDAERLGVITGITRQDTLDELRRKIEKQVEKSRRKGNRSNAANVVIDATTILPKGVNVIADLTKSLAEWSENQTRFTVYYAAIKSGKTKEQATTIAKEATTNFNRVGKYSGNVGAWFMFFNARVQGIDRYFRMWKKAPVAAATETIIKGAMGYGLRSLLTNWAKALWGKDDEDEEGIKKVAKISQYMKNNYLIIPLVGDRYLSLPLSHGHGMAFAMGGILYDYVHEDDPEKLDRAVKNTLDAIVSNTVPLDLGQITDNDGNLSVRPFMPSMLLPAYDIATNTTFTGAPILPEPFTKEQDEEMAMSQRYYKNVNPLIKRFTDWNYVTAGGRLDGRNSKNYYMDENLNRVTIPMYRDISPEQLEHVIESALGGTGKFYIDLTKSLVFPAYEGLITLQEGKGFARGWKEGSKDLGVNDYPIVQRLIREAVIDPVTKVMYEEFDKSRDYIEDANLYRKSKDPETRELGIKMSRDPKYAEAKDIKNLGDLFKDYRNYKKYDLSTKEQHELDEELGKEVRRRQVELYKKRKNNK